MNRRRIPPEPRDPDAVLTIVVLVGLAVLGFTCGLFAKAVFRG